MSSNILGVNMNHKGSLIISYLALIILTILLLYLTGGMKIVTIIVAIMADLLILSAVAGNKSWEPETRYGFFIFIVYMIFLGYSLLSGQTELKQWLSLGVILALIIGFFLTTLSSDTPKRKPKNKKGDKVEVVELDEPKPTKIKKERFASAPESDKYHIPTCGYLKNTPRRKLQHYNNKKHAESMGLQPCRTCVE